MHTVIAERMVSERWLINNAPEKSAIFQANSWWRNKLSPSSLRRECFNICQ